jgi:hypothetical protein
MYQARTGRTVSVHIVDEPEIEKLRMRLERHLQRQWCRALCGTRVRELVVNPDTDLPLPVNSEDLATFPGGYRWCGSCAGIYRRELPTPRRIVLPR